MNITTAYVSDQSVIKVSNDEVEFTAVKFVAKANMYYRDLQKNYKDLVSISDVAETFVKLVKYYHKIDKLDSDTWQQICDMYKPFIHMYRPWEDIQNTMKLAQWEEKK